MLVGISFDSINNPAMVQNHHKSHKISMHPKVYLHFRRTFVIYVSLLADKHESNLARRGSVAESCQNSRLLVQQQLQQTMVTIRKISFCNALDIDCIALLA